jgi:hypothetical protein
VRKISGLTLTIFIMLCTAVFADETTSAAPAAPLGLTINNVWMMVATFLVFIMHLGFASLEAGLTRSKNTVNILFKNTLIPAIGLLTYAFLALISCIQELSMGY